MKKTPQDTMDNKIYKFLTEKMQYNGDIAKKIIKTIQEHTNQDYNFDMYRDYKDEIDEKYIGEFLSKYRNRFDSLDEAKAELRSFLDEEFDFMRETTNEYMNNLIDDLDDIIFDNDNKKGLKISVNGASVVEHLQNEFGILFLDYDLLDLCKGQYRVVVCSTKYHDLFTNLFSYGKYEDIAEIKDKKDEYLLQKMCKSQGFDVEDIFIYQKTENEQKRGKYEELRKNNKFFDDLYNEFNNTFGYNEDLLFLTNMNIENLLKYACVKNQKYNLKNTSFGFYDHINGSGSCFDGDIDFDFEVNTDDLEVYLYTSIQYMEDCYGFTSKAFGL